MITKSLGQSEIRLPAIGMGAGDFFWNADIAYDRKVRLLRTGIEVGMGFIDTAEEYGSGVSEEIVSEAIQGVRDRVIVATKFSPEHNGYSDVLKAVEGSLKRLKTDYIDIYQVHWTNPTVPIAETMRALRRLLETGTIRCAGVCNFSQKELIEAQDSLGDHRVASLQTEYNLFERTVEYSGLLPYCTENNVSVVAYSPLDQGRFSRIGKGKREVLNSIASKYEKTVAQVILRWLVSNPAVVAITRTTSEKHLIENSGAMDFELQDSDIELINISFPVDVIEVPTDRIRVSTEGEWNHAVYQTVEEAIENRHGSVPSPLDLAQAIEGGEFLKPVRLVASTDERYDYDLIGGRIRYWAWVIAHQGEVPIAAYVREGLD